MTQLQQLLTELNACIEAKKWAEEKSWQEVYDTCHRGDWLLWLYAQTNPDDIRGITLAKGLCANTVRHLMKDERSVKAVDAAIAFGNGEIERHELDTAAAAAADAAAAAAFAATYAGAGFAAAAAFAAAYAGAAAAFAAANAAAAATYAADDAKRQNQQETADIVRSVLPIEKWNIKI